MAMEFMSCDTLTNAPLLEEKNCTFGLTLVISKNADNHRVRTERFELRALEEVSSAALIFLSIDTSEADCAYAR